MEDPSSTKVTVGATTDATSSAPAMVNPHNPEFITKKPWYLGDSNSNEPTLDHQKATSAQLAKKNKALSLSESEAIVAKQRKQAAASHKNRTVFEKGEWVEALKRNKMPYRICQIVSVIKNPLQTTSPTAEDGYFYDLKFEDGTLEKRVAQSFVPRPRIRRTQQGTRTSTSVLDSETYDSKRDAYHGYDPDSHNARLVARFERREDIRKKLRETLQKSSSDQTNDNNDDDDDNNNDNYNSDEEFIHRDEDDRVITTRLARQGGVGGAQMKVTARNLRIREDTAKYLRNLDPDSAYYDPKSRSMRDNPNPEIPPEQSLFAGDNFFRVSGDAVQLADTQLFAWDAADKGVEQVHPQANPSQVELLKKQFRAKATDFKAQKKKDVLEKYGGEEYLDGTGGLASVVETKKPIPPKNLRFGATTVVHTFAPDPRSTGDHRTTTIQSLGPLASKYEENVFIHGHTTVWGSYFHRGAFHWGYADDHSLLKMSYCTGEAGRAANDEANELQYGTGQAGSAQLAQIRKLISSHHHHPTHTKQQQQPPRNNNKTWAQQERELYGQVVADSKPLDPNKLREAQERLDQKEAANNGKRKYNSTNQDGGVVVTVEDMEVYRRSKIRGKTDDPMAPESMDRDDDDPLLVE